MNGTVRTDRLGVVVFAALLVVSAAGPFVGPAGAAQEETDTPRAPLSSLAGSGTLDDPYVITNADELQAMNQDLSAHYVLGSDVDAGETETWNAGNGFEPVGIVREPFTGSFDGRGHTIEGLTIIRPSEEVVGLFGASEGTVQNVSLTDARVNGDQGVGGLIGQNAGSVTGSSVDGEVYGAAQETGGLVGRNLGQIVASSASVTVEGETTVGGLVGLNRGPVRGSYATGSVTGSERVGGLVGINRDAVTASYARATVEAEDQLSGGFAGLNDGTITSSYTASSVEQARLNGSIAGSNSGTIVDVYWDANASGTAKTPLGNGGEAGTMLTTAEMSGENASDALDGFDFANIWTTEESYPVHQWERPDVDPLDQWQVPTPEPTPTPTPTVPGGNETATVGSSGVGPGFGPAAAVGALAAVVLFGRFRRRNGGNGA